MQLCRSFSFKVTMNPKVITETQVASLLPTRPNDSHKGQFGSVSIIGGASGMIGAAILAARAALKMGAGCVHVYLLAKNAPSIDLAQPELMIHNAAEGMLENHITHACDVWLAGCGMGTDGDAQELLKKCLLHSGALVLDADALNLIAQQTYKTIALLPPGNLRDISPVASYSKAHIACVLQWMAHYSSI